MTQVKGCKSEMRKTEYRLVVYEKSEKWGWLYRYRWYYYLRTYLRRYFKKLFSAPNKDGYYLYAGAGDDGLTDLLWVHPSGEVKTIKEEIALTPAHHALKRIDEDHLVTAIAPAVYYRRPRKGNQGGEDGKQ